MPGPLQWSQEHGRLVPATGTLPSADAVFDDDFDEAPDPRFASKSAATAPRKSVAKSEPVNVLQLAKARLRDVKRELRQMKALQKECAELERLISAAESKPRAVVRDLKRSAG